MSEQKVPTWSDLMNLIRTRATSDLQKTVVPAVDRGRKTLGSLLVAIGAKIQSQRHSDPPRNLTKCNPAKSLEVNL